MSKDENSGGRFRSSDLWVMSPTRFRCATPLFAVQNDWGEIRTLASEDTGALNQRLRPLGHPALRIISPDGFEPST